MPEPLVASAMALFATLVGWFAYLASIPKEKVAARPAGTLLIMAVASALAILALWPSVTGAQPWNPAVIALSAVALSLAAFFVYLLRQAPLPDGELKVARGQALLPFSATASDGEAFESTQLKGGRVLLKFFRGHW